MPSPLNSWPPHLALTYLPAVAEEVSHPLVEWCSQSACLPPAEWCSQSACLPLAEWHNQPGSTAGSEAGALQAPPLQPLGKGAWHLGGVGVEFGRVGHSQRLAELAAGLTQHSHRSGCHSCRAQSNMSTAEAIVHSIGPHLHLHPSL